jgi:hypothetical protein
VDGLAQDAPDENDLDRFRALGYLTGERFAIVTSAVTCPAVRRLRRCRRRSEFTEVPPLAPIAEGEEVSSAA